MAEFQFKVKSPIKHTFKLDADEPYEAEARAENFFAPMNLGFGEWKNTVENPTKFEWKQNVDFGVM